MGNEEYRFIAVDMDGTILDKEYRISKAVREALVLCRQQGRKVIISTGRVYSSAAKHLEAAGGADGFVCSNGADVFDAAGGVIHQYHLNETASRRLVDISRDYDSHFCGFLGDIWHYEAERAYTSFYTRRSGIEGVLTNFDNFGTLSFTKCLFIDDREKLLPIKARIEAELGNQVQMLFSADFMLEIVTKGVSKSRGLRAFVEHFGGSLDQVIAFGDAENDEDMLLAAGHGVAMGNASEEFKARIGHVAPSVDEDGVAVYLKEFFGIS
jgi:Cof subfamily protein (haloacid dehalogenase superfamily)